MPIATPEVHLEMLDRAKAGSFAYPAINVTSSQGVNAALQGFAEAESDGIVQVSTGGAEFLSGGRVKDRVVGATALPSTPPRWPPPTPVHRIGDGCRREVRRHRVSVSRRPEGSLVLRSGARSTTLDS